MSSSDLSSVVGVVDWRPSYRVRAIHSNVLLVARTRIEGAWCAYCVPVPGERHDKEYELWREHGEKLPEPLARVAFPEFDGVPYAH